MWNLVRNLCLGALLLMPLSSAAQTKSVDPLNSIMWDYLRQQFIGEAPYRFDDQVVVEVPAFAEDPTQVPITVDATAFDGQIERIVAWADFNPIQHIFTYTPLSETPARLSLRIKVQQATPVRAAVLTRDGVWHLGGGIVDAAGGGCTTPSVGNADPYWESHLGQIQSRLFNSAQGSRFKFRIIHPMDTGLVDAIPEFYLQQLVLRDGSGRELLRMALSPPVSENPVFTFGTAATVRGQRIWLRDNNGNEFEQAL